MLPVQPYRPGKYPPGPQYPQFGDDALHKSLEEARRALAERRSRLEHFHLSRLEAHHLMPYNRTTPSQVPRARDPEEEGVQSFDHPPPPPGRQPERRQQSEPAGPPAVYMDAESDEEPQLAPLAPPPRSIGGSFMNGANSTASSIGAAVVHGGTYAVGATVGAVLKGGINGLAHLATGVNPLTTRDEEEEESAGAVMEPLQAYPKPKPKAKAQPASSSSGSGLGRSSPEFRPFVDVGPYQGGTVDVSDDEPAPRNAPARPGFRQIARRDVELARQTLDPNLGRGKRRNQGG